ncbi:putative RNA recognition motif domain, nucleotide-binding alpha-beta plait domain superfamily [Helianthus annuus]|nr:putative RNA recognition motif domain, nucleotide-binding alpha-beta plait domain superfamily [Helianthus annuus]
MGENNQGVVRFFVNNLPDKCSSKDVGDLFSSFGDVMSVYEVRKRDKNGLRFGFVGFKGVRDRRQLELSLKDVKMGSFKLKVNVARFSVVNNVSPRQSEKSFNCSAGLNGDARPGGQAQGNRPFVPNPLGTAYRDSLLGASKMSVPEDLMVEVSSFVKPEEDWFDRSLIARAANLQSLVKLDYLLKDHKVSLKYVGGLYMLLIFDGSEEAVRFKEHNPGVKVWFSWLEVWKGQALPFERITWLKIMGVPLHLVNVEVFDSIGRLFGKVVHTSKMSNEVKDLTYDLVGVLVRDGEKICKLVTLKWNDMKFKIWVDEEKEDWVPDCIGVGDSCVEEMENSSESGKEDGFFPNSPAGGGRSSEMPIDGGGSQRVDQVSKGRGDEQLGGFFQDCMGNNHDGNAVAQVPREGPACPVNLEKGDFLSGFNFNDFVESRSFNGGPEVPVKAQKMKTSHKAHCRLFVSSTGKPNSKKRRRVDDPFGSRLWTLPRPP